MNSFDTYIILKDTDWAIIKDNLHYIRRNIPAQKFFIITSPSIREKVESENFSFIDENKIYPGLTFQSVKDFLQLNCLDQKNTGWYLQQFIKYAISYSCDKDYYLVWDADTIPLNPINFFDTAGSPLFNLKREYFKIYFDFIIESLGIKKKTSESFISEHMLFNKSILLELINKLTQGYSTDYSFWQIILMTGKKLKNIDYKDQRFFSEFETYGTYIDNFYPNLYKRRKLRTLRSAADFLGNSPSDEVLEWVSKSFDTISIEKWAQILDFSVQKINTGGYINTTSFETHIKESCLQIKKTYYKALFLRQKETAKKLAPIIGSWKFDFYFGNSLPYSEQKSIVRKIIRRIYLCIKYIILGA